MKKSVPLNRIIVRLCILCAFILSLTTAQAMSEDQYAYINKCVTVNYKDVERNPSQFKGKDICVSGRIIQVSEGWFNSVTIRLDEGSNNIWYVTYVREDENESRILEDDYLTFYGVCDGVKTYSSVLGGSITIPALTAKAVSFESEVATVETSTNDSQGLLPGATWICSNCGNEASGNFCSNCGSSKVEETISDETWDDNSSSTENVSISDILPQDAVWEMTLTQYKNNSSLDLEICNIGEKKGLRLSEITIDSYTITAHA